MDEHSEACHDRVALALVLRFLQDAGYERALEALTIEAGVNYEQVEAAETASLSAVVRDYEALFREKHGHAPELTSDNANPQPLRLRPETIAGTTKLFGSAAPVNQVDFFRVLCANRSMDPASLFYIELPLSCARRFRPSQLTLTAEQEHLLYGLVGCADVGWRLSSVHQNSRTILEEKYGITKRMLQLFFKNRSQQKQRRKRKKTRDDEPRPLSTDPMQRELLGEFVPIAPAPQSSSELLQVNSLLEMVKGEEFDHGVPSTLIHPQTLESYAPAAHLATASGSGTASQLP